MKAGLKSLPFPKLSHRMSLLHCPPSADARGRSFVARLRAPAGSTARWIRRSSSPGGSFPCGSSLPPPGTLVWPLLQLLDRDVPELDEGRRARPDPALLLSVALEGDPAPRGHARGLRVFGPAA